MNMEKINRINELFHKSKNGGLTEPERQEQAKLRKEYIENIRRNMRGTLDNISIKEPDGSITDLSQKVMSKRAEDKKRLRNDLKQQRKHLIGEDRTGWDQKIFDHVMSLPETAQTDCLYCYCSLDQEVSTWMLMAAFWEQGKKVAVPRVEGEEIHFYYIEDRSDLTPGCMEIPEPVRQCERADAPQGLMLIPGLGFDESGNRLGYGGGYYDRYLSQHPDVVKVAVAYEFQVVDNLVTESWDQTMNILITENKIRRF